MFVFNFGNKFQIQIISQLIFIKEQTLLKNVWDFMAFVFKIHSE